MLNKSDAEQFIRDRDAYDIEKQINAIDKALRERWNESMISVGFNEKFLSKHIINAVEAEVTKHGWTIKYVAGGSDMRGDEWNGHWEIS